MRGPFLRGLSMAAALWLLLSLTACARPSAQGSAASAPQEAQIEEADAPGPLVVVGMSEITNVYAEAMGAALGTDVELVQTSNETDERMIADFAAGRASYDVLELFSGMGVYYSADGFVDKGFYADITDVEGVREAVQAMLPVLRAHVSRDGRYFALPTELRTKTLSFDGALYEAWQAGSLDTYGREHFTVVTDADARFLGGMEKRPYDTWPELIGAFSNDGFRLLHVSGDTIANALLEQYVLGMDEEGFSFDTEGFVSVLELKKACFSETETGALDGTASPLRVDFNSFSTYFIDRSVSPPTAVRERNREVFAPPTVDEKGRLAASVTELAVNAFSTRKKAAFRFLSAAADVGLNGRPDYDPVLHGAMRYGSLYSAACYADNAHLVEVVGEEPEAQARWLALTERLAVSSSAGFLTAFHNEIFPMYLDGAIDAAQCAALTQQRYEMYRMEQGG